MSTDTPIGGCGGSESRITLDSALAGLVKATANGPVYVIEQDPASILVAGGGACEMQRFFRGHCSATERAQPLSPELDELAAIEPDQVLFLDIETAGLHGHPLFLIGLLSYGATGIGITQLLARDFPEEPAAIAEFADICGRYEAVVTFNGRCFDLPFIANRAALWNLQLRLPPLDIDLLPTSRRLWGNRLPDCRLGTLEQCICGRRREDDLPSHLVPRAYMDFINTGEARDILRVIRHNVWDLVTMADLLSRATTASICLADTPPLTPTRRRTTRRPKTAMGVPISEDGPFAGMTVVITGTLEEMKRAEAEELIRSLGGKVSSSVSKATTLLVIGEGPGAKLDRARLLGTKIIDQNEFRIMAGLD